ncbi:MAG TPA: hypothetical protein VFM14_02605 [Gemmatimonadales bacterium]|nr:hypothetical protein [Gemmatimonadales bacterium]
MSPTDPADDIWQPRRPLLVALLVFGLATLTLCWPMLSGRFLLGDDQHVVGYGFRAWSAEYFREHGSIPQWNPYLFGGLPFVAAQHGDVFYPTAWLRWILPVDTAMNLGFAGHILLAGVAMYCLLRRLSVGWAGAVTGGVAYQLTGIVASLVKPGHDGKLFVSALAPLAFVGLLAAVRHRQLWGYGLLALTVGLCMLSPHYQMTYYLLVAAGLWTLWLALRDPERNRERKPLVPIGIALGAVMLGVAIAAIQVIPFLEYIPFSPRAAGGPSGGWEYATAFSMPPEELVTAILPQFNGVLDEYWGRNFFKLHTEYLGASVVLLAALGWGDRRRHPLLIATGAIAGIFLLISFGGHTPFYRLWYEVMPMMKKVRAPGMAFFLVALFVAVWAGIGTDRLLRGDVPRRTLAFVVGALGVFALLGLVGGLQGVATLLTTPQQAERVGANAGALQAGAGRLLAVVVATAAVAFALRSGRLRGVAAALVFPVIAVADLWSVDRLFFEYQDPAHRLFDTDDVVSRVKAARGPFRMLDLPPPSGVYFPSLLMAQRIPSVLGYHGNELRFYDELLGGKNVWANLGSQNVLDLVATRYLVLPDTQTLAGWHHVTGPVLASSGRPAVLFERDSAVPWARVLPAAVKVPDAQAPGALADPRFPYRQVAVLPDTASITPEPIKPGHMPAPAETRAEVLEWEPGRMRVALHGADPKPTYLVISESWYPDWHVSIDGKPAALIRADHAFLGVVLPPGARDVRLWFDSASYRRGRLVTLLAILATAGLIATPLIRARGSGG